jgi:hypothetical protein
MSDRSEVMTVAKDLFVAAMETKAIGQFKAKGNKDTLAEIGELYHALALRVAETFKVMK